MIEDFVPQPYPLELSTDGETWELVLGWSPVNGDMRPVTTTHPDLGGLSFRQALPASVQRAMVGPAAAASSSSIAPAERTARRPEKRRPESA